LALLAPRGKLEAMAPSRHTDPDAVELDGSPSIVEAAHPLSMVYGGGGVYGIAYGIGVALGLAERGIAVRQAPALGTSAGSWVASAMALGMDYTDFDGMEAPSVPTRKDTMHRIAREVFGDARHHLVSASAVHIPGGRRHILDGGRYDLADLVAASSAVPGVFPPHRIDGRQYVDGGMWSATSVDAASDAERVIVIAPLAGPVMGPMGRTGGFLLDRELGRWRSRHPGKTIALIRPNREIGRMAGRNPRGLFDAKRAHDVFPAAYEQGLVWGLRLLDADAA
jgi:NTE family protein